MRKARDGQSYAPDFPETKPVVQPGEFVFAAAYFDHGHIHGQIKGLVAAGGQLKYVYDPQPERIESTLADYPGARAVTDFDEILQDPSIQLVTAAAVPSSRCPIGLRVMEADKDYLTDKPPLTSLEQLAQAREAVKRTGRKYMVCYSERLLSESTYHAGEMVRDGVIGDVLHILNLAPHNLNAPSRPEWFFQKPQYGGIITDLGSHQIEQFMHFSQARDATIDLARVANLGHPEYPGLEDFGEVLMTTDTGAACYCRVDWFTPGGLRTWGDGRTFVLGTKGSIEIRKYIDLARDTGGGLILLVDETKEHEIPCMGRIGFPYFGKLVLDVLNRTETAMTQEHAFKAAELSLLAQQMADLKNAPPTAG